MQQLQKESSFRELSSFFKSVYFQKKTLVYFWWIYTLLIAAFLLWLEVKYQFWTTII